MSNTYKMVTLIGTSPESYETAIDKLCTWEVNGKRVRPKVIASSSSVLNSRPQ